MFIRLGVGEVRLKPCAWALPAWVLVSTFGLGAEAGAADGPSGIALLEGSGYPLVTLGLRELRALRSRDGAREALLARPFEPALETAARAGGLAPIALLADLEDRAAAPWRLQPGAEVGFLTDALALGESTFILPRSTASLGDVPVAGEGSGDAEAFAGFKRSALYFMPEPWELQDWPRR